MRLSKREILVVLLSCLVVVCSFVATRRKPRGALRAAGKVVRVSGLKTRVGPASLRISWHSDIPSQSTIEILEPSRRIVDGADAGTSTSHLVIVNNLNPDTLYTIKISSTSKVFSIRTLAFHPEILACFGNAEYGYDLVVKLDNAITVSATLLDNSGKGRLVPVQRNGKGIFTASLPKLDEYIKDIVITAEAIEGKSLDFSVKSILAEQISALSLKLSFFNSAKILAGLNRYSFDSLDDVFARVTGESKAVAPGIDEQAEIQRIQDKKLEAIRDEYDERLENTGLLHEYEKARKLALLVLGCALLPLDERISFFKILREFQEYRVALALRHVVSKLQMPRWGAFALSDKPLDRHWNELLLSQNLRRPPRLGPKMPFARANVLSSFTLKFPLTGPQACCESELCLTIATFSKILARLKINNRVSFLFFDRPLGRHDKSKHNLYQRLPAGLLKSGDNTLKITLDLTYGRRVVETIPIYRIALRLPGKAMVANSPSAVTGAGRDK